MVSSAADKAGSHHVVAIADGGDVAYASPIPFRGHDVIASPDRRSLVCVARRPGRELIRLRMSDGEIQAAVSSDVHRHFYGHALFTPDGRYLFTTENDLITQQGIVTVRDADSLRKIETFSSHGIGPHELRWSHGGRFIAVANGGIATHPDYGRTPLNVDSMTPNLVLIDPRNGALVKSLQPRHTKNSVRHIDVLPDNRVFVAMQQQDRNAANQHIIGLASWDNRFNELPMDVADVQALANYTASVACDAKTGNAVITAPRGHRVALWHAKQSRFLPSLRLPDAAGVCVDTTRREFVISSGRGMLYRLDAATLRLNNESTIRVADFSWDNHLTFLNS
ncbi:MAG: DUF1513 domain-containing protein [Pseudomonadota bacterium]